MVAWARFVLLCSRGMGTARRGQPVADPNRTSSTALTSVARVFAVRTVRASHRLAPTSGRYTRMDISKGRV